MEKTEEEEGMALLGWRKMVENSMTMMHKDYMAMQVLVVHVVTLVATCVMSYKAMKNVAQWSCCSVEL